MGQEPDGDTYLRQIELRYEGDRYRYNPHKDRWTKPEWTDVKIVDDDQLIRALNRQLNRELRDLHEHSQRALAL